MKRDNILFVGRTAYEFPLDNVIYRKWSLLSEHFRINILASTLSLDMKFVRRYKNINFFLIQKQILADQLFFFIKALRYVLVMILRHNIEIIICQGPLEGIISIIGKNIAKLFGKRVKVVQEVHGDWENAYTLYWKISFSPIRMFINLVIKALLILLIKNADAIRTITSFIRNKIQKYAKHKYVIQFPGYIDIDYFLKEEQNLQKKETKTILFIGALHYLKGVHHLLEAIPRIKSMGIQKIQVIIVGNGPYHSVLRELSLKLNIEEDVLFIGRKTQLEVKKYILQSDVIVLPSLSEGLGRVLIEAMACGKPVVASRIGGIPEIIKENYNGFLFQPGNVGELASKIYKVLENPKLSKKLGKNGRDFAQNFFSVEKYINGYKTLIDHLDSS